MSKVSGLHREWSRNPEYREAYGALGPEFEQSHSGVEARTSAELTQAEFQERARAAKNDVNGCRST